MPGNDTLNKLIAVLAISTSAYLAGFTASISILTVPVLPLSGWKTSTRQWAALYSLGSRLGPPMGLSSLSLFLYSAWANGALQYTPRGLIFALAGVCGAANMPWTRLAMVPTNAALKRIADESEEVVRGIEGDEKAREGREREVRELVGRWRWLNFVRSVGPMVGAVLGGVGAVGLV